MSCLPCEAQARARRQEIGFKGFSRGFSGFGTGLYGVSGGLGVGSPASQNCKDLGGEEIVTSAPGAPASADCVLPDGTRCETWALFRKECGPGAAKTERWDMKGDLIAGGVGLALPIAYDYLAPKKWPKLALWHRVVIVVVGYFGASYAYRKL